MSYSLNSTYVAFDTLSEDELKTVSKDAQLERGFVQDRPLFPARRIKPLKGGSDWMHQHSMLWTGTGTQLSILLVAVVATKS